MIDIQTLPIVAPKFYGPITGVRSIRLAVLHDGEWPERPQGAMGLAKYFQRPDPGTKPSAHLCGDNVELVRCVRDHDVANAAPGANHDGLQFEMVGYGRQTRAEWLDEYSKGVIAIAGDAFAQWCVTYGLPPRKLTVAEVADHKTKGICDHATVTKAFGLSTHTDPGSGFPWDIFIVGVAASMAKIVVTPHPGDRRWSGYFKDWVYLTSYTSDTSWRFSVGKPSLKTFIAATPWSQMPHSP